MATFVDQVTLHLRAGDGGDGCVSVKREKFKPLAGPDGGNGGNGGDIVLVSDPQVTTLLGFHRAPHRKSERGGQGMGDHRSGAHGEEVELAVPVGTVVKDPEGNELIDFTDPGMRFVAAKGGQGGLGNAALASAKRKAPGFALLGTPGFEGDVFLELKVVADVALVGYPSAGKSSLVAAISAAKPKIADYPFTTLHPNLGVVKIGERDFVLADIPGLIEGAHEGIGIGDRFLGHIERCNVLIHLIDGTQDDVKSIYKGIRNELFLYDELLAEKPELVVLNKIDAIPEEEAKEKLKVLKRISKAPVFGISAATHQGIDAVLYAVIDVIDRTKAEREEAARRAVEPNWAP